MKSHTFSNIKINLHIYLPWSGLFREYFYETLSIDFDGDGINEDSEIRGRYLENDELYLNNNKPYVIYGYAAVGPNQILTVEKGARIHFHRNSGIIVGNGGSIQVSGELSNSIDTLENEVIIQGDRLEPYFEDIPGQWGLIWLMDGSLNNKFNFTTQFDLDKNKLNNDESML